MTQRPASGYAFTLPIAFRPDTKSYSASYIMNTYPICDFSL